MVEAATTKKPTSMEISEKKRGDIATGQFKKTTQYDNGGGSTRVIQEAPVLEKVEKLEHVDVVKTKKVHEKHKQDVIEVHEKPVEKVVKHAPQEVFVKEQTLFETEGKQDAKILRDRVIREMEEDKHHPITFTEQKDVSFHEMKPSISRDTQFKRQIIEKPIVTEIHHQPIKEIHEQEVNRVVYEKPIVNVVRDAIIREEEYDSKPMSSFDARLGVRDKVVVKDKTATTTESAHKNDKLHNLAESIKEKCNVHEKKTSETTPVEKKDGIIAKNEKAPLPLIK